MQAQADATLEVLLEYGVSHIDTAPRYGDSELRIWPWMREHRKRFFLATKTQPLALTRVRPCLLPLLTRTLGPIGKKQDLTLMALMALMA
jgi:predicted aldo/keto reductase-like oxidoreductase